MRKYALCAVLLLVLPASASISYVRSNPQWGGGSSSCAVSLTTTNANDMIVVWAEWQTAGGFPNTITVSSILDGTNTFRSAIGPTVQPTGNVAAQIFYAAKILAGGDTVTVSFSGTVASSACVIAEYSGADLLYPLDSVSAGYSYSLNPGTALDSGAAAPANPNFMVFGAGIVDVVGTPNTTSPFQIRQNTPNTSAVCGFVEDNVTPTAQTLQHAYASCTGSGDWLMQMAVFRSASWTVAGGWSPVRPYQVLDATQFPGTDPCAATKAAIETPVGGNNSPVVDSRGFISTAIPCANAPFSSSDTGWLDLPSGLIQNQNPWVFGNNGMWLHGTGRGSPSGTLGTIIEAQTAVSGSNTPVAIFQMSSGPEFANGADHLALDGNGLAGSMGIQDDFCQEECGFDYLKITNTTVAGADFGFGAGNVQHGVNLTNFEIITPLIGGNTNPSCGPGVNALAISGVSVDASGVVTATVSSTTGLYVRNEAVITGIPSGVTHATNFNGTYAITKVTSLTQFQYEINVTQSDSAGSGGVISTYNIPLRVWTVIGASLHAIRNGTITMGNCRATLPSGAYTAEFSGPSPIVVEGLHEEGAGIDIGGLGPTSNVDIESGDGQAGGATNHVVNDITISNQWGTPTNIIIRNRTGKGQVAGGNPPTNMIVDLPNGNTISYANNPIVSEYKLDGTGFPHAMLAKCSDMTKGWCDDGQTNSLYIGGTKVFSVDDSSGNVSTAGHLNQSATGKFAGSCSMLNATTCSFSIGTAFTSAPLGFASVQSATPIQGSCTLSVTTATITASTMNTNTWGCLLIGNPN